ncbi:MarR family winged helix-turn-helix transcriptional regulator [Yeosuana marina]|uniref:MarR family winged helix-turn-helix transcriptional regulator n=1 Tax=Yeosuana marina TaxID=1565536 RepID=UPI00141DD754|nr:MarR family winged helix-turn-helix transcriptional regulator [Yeosuana marina]
MNKEILREIGKIYRALNSFSDFFMKSVNLEKGQYQFLMRVKENPGINQQNLSTNLLVDKTTTAKAVNKLVAKGYILKKVDQKDKRNVKLHLTEKGKNICMFLDQEEKFVTKISLDGLDEIEQKILLNKLSVIINNVTDIYAEIKNENKKNLISLIKKEKI